MSMLTGERDRAALLDMAYGFIRGKVLNAVVRLGIPDALVAGPRTAQQLADTAAAPADALLRLLRAAATLGVLAELAPGHFALTEFGRPLATDDPESVWASMIFWPELIADSYGHLAEFVRAGGSAAGWDTLRSEGQTPAFERVPDARAIFHAEFARNTAEDNRPYAQAYDFSAAHRVADLGGGGGGLLAAVLLAYPHLEGLLVDRLQAVDGAIARFVEVAVEGRCDVLAGDLLESVPAGADVYLMRSVLHGYDDADALRVLENCAAVMNADTRLLVIEPVLPDVVDRADPALEPMFMADLLMFAVTGGRERSALQWEQLVGATNCEIRRIVPIPGTTHNQILEIARRAGTGR
jgi:hypothetical protein